MDVFYSAPPITRTLTAAVVITSCACYANRTLFSYVLFEPSRIIYAFPPEIWRIFTGFLISGANLYIILDPYFLFTYGKMLETGSPRFRRKGDFAWYVLFNILVIALLSALVIGAPLLNEALMLAFVHTVAQDNPRMKAHFVIFEIEARLLPVCLLFLNFVTRGPQSAMVSAAGLGSAHLFDFLTRIWPTFGGGRNWIAPPPMWSRMFGDDRARVQVKSYGDAHYRSTRDPMASSSGSSAAANTTGASWRSRGAGRRLGD